MPFQQGNSKLGNKIYTWSIPAGTTCPGMSKPCEECYAQNGFFKMTNVKTALERNLDLTSMQMFVRWAVSELNRLKAKVVRIHVAGDFYDAEYANKWKDIIFQCPNIRFFVYTRSWRIDSIRPILEQMSKLKNLRSWWSVDYDTGKPKRLPKTVRLAYMQINELDIPKFPVHLVFRVDELRNLIVKKINHAMVCPVENGITENMTCMKCGFCWKDRNEVNPFATTQITPIKKPPKKLGLPLI